MSADARALDRSLEAPRRPTALADLALAASEAGRPGGRVTSSDRQDCEHIRMAGSPGPADHPLDGFRDEIGVAHVDVV